MSTLTPILVSNTLETPPVPFGIVASIETFESAREGLRRRDLTCVLKAKGQQSEHVFGLYGDRRQVMAFAKVCKRDGKWTFCTDAKGLL